MYQLFIHLFLRKMSHCRNMTEGRIKLYIVICSFIKWTAVYSAEENQFPKGHQERLGSHQPPEGNIEELLAMPTASVFYDNYVAKSKPVILKGAAKESDAFKLWTDNYLGENFGDVEVNVDYGKKENRERPADVMTLREFLQMYNKTNRYLVDSLPDALQSEFQLPQCILCGGFTERLADSVLWFSSGGTKSFLHIDNVENINCLISGQKEWFFIDKENSKKIEVDHGEGEYCGVDVDEVDMIKYPSLQTMPWWSAHMVAGDCMYVPYGWAHQVRSYSRNIAVNIWWAAMKSFNYSDCKHSSEQNPERKTLSEYKFTHGEQIRFLILDLLERHGGQLTFDIMHKMIRHEHDGRHIVDKKSFALLDKNRDDIVVVEEIESRDPEVLEIALQRTLPGEINIRGTAQGKDPKLLGILKRVEKQEPFIEEFLLRINKSTDDIRNFLETYGEKLHSEIKEYLQEVLDSGYTLDLLREEL